MKKITAVETNFVFLNSSCHVQNNMEYMDVTQNYGFKETLKMITSEGNPPKNPICCHTKEKKPWFDSYFGAGFPHVLSHLGQRNSPTRTRAVEKGGQKNTTSCSG